MPADLGIAFDSGRMTARLCLDRGLSCHWFPRISILFYVWSHEDAMGTLTGDQQRLPGQCEHKLPASCRLTSIPNCCACADERAHAPTYSTYIDGIGFVSRGNRWQRYCWFCKGTSTRSVYCHTLTLSRVLGEQGSSDQSTADPDTNTRSTGSDRVSGEMVRVS